MMEPDPGRKNMNSAPLKVLLVEDSPSDAALLKESLTQSGLERFEFTHVECWAEAAKNLRQGHFDILLLDLSLPDSTGQDTFLRARAEVSDLPIVVLTGFEDESVGHRSRSLRNSGLSDQRPD